MVVLPGNDHGFDEDWGAFSTQIARARIQDFLRPYQHAVIPPRESPDLRPRRGLALASALPLASLLAVELYARNFDGWGAWSTALLFLVPFFLSLAIGLSGISCLLSEHRAGCAQASTVVSTCIALLPLAWLLLRRHFV